MACKRNCMDCVDCLAPLPKGKTCADCRFFYHCKQFMLREGTETSCDWIPSRFHLAISHVPTQRDAASD